MEKTWTDPSEVRQGDKVEVEGTPLVVVATLQGKAGTTLYLDDESKAFYPKGEWTLVAVFKGVS